MRYILICLLLTLSAQAQDFSEDWTGHFSFNDVIDVTSGNGRIYAASENAVFIFNTLDGSIQKRTTINGLSGNIVSSIYYSEGFDTLFVGYENGVMDVIVGNTTNVLTVVDIFNKPSITPDRKNINHFTEFNGFVYISTGFGIALFDLGQLEFDDSYFIGDNGALLNITATAIKDEFIYAATTDGGLRRALVNNSNIIDFANWTTTREGVFQDLTLVGETLFLQDNVTIRQSTDGVNFTTLQNFPNAPRDIRNSEGALSLVRAGSVQYYNEDGSILFSFSNLIEETNQYSTSISLNGNLFVATLGEGLLRFNPETPDDITIILPNGPLENNHFGIGTGPGIVWSVFGEYNTFYNPGIPNRRGASRFTEEEGWFNIPFSELFDARDIARATVNPRDPSQVYLSSFFSGLVEVIDTIPTIIYDENNSTFNPVPTTTDQIRVNGAAFDTTGNLWVATSRGTEQIHRLSPNGQFTAVNTSSVISEGVNSIDELVIAPEGTIYLSTTEGLVGYDPSTGNLARIFGEESGANFPNDDIRSLAVDRNGSLWIGTSRGLRVLFSPSQMFEDPQVSSNAIIIEQDGLAQELLNEQTVTVITVDGSNNKWLGTTDSGAFLVSPNGQEILFEFNETNSPLPSNTIQEIAIDPQTGSIYFGTTRGLVAFDGSSTIPAEDLENVLVYPNPVRPGFSGNVRVEGLTARTNVKITDLVGNLVYEENTTGGSIEWDTTAFGRHKVASGVYLILITGPAGEQVQETQIAKLMVIR